jgi:hypothetical protein
MNRHRVVGARLCEEQVEGRQERKRKYWSLTLRCGHVVHRVERHPKRKPPPSDTKGCPDCGHHRTVPVRWAEWVVEPTVVITPHTRHYWLLELDCGHMATREPKHGEDAPGVVMRCDVCEPPIRSDLPHHQGHSFDENLRCRCGMRWWDHHDKPRPHV